MLSAGAKVSISIHALHEESDRFAGGLTMGVLLFQSTLSMRRATRMDELCRDTIKFQSTLSMRRATAAKVDHVAAERFQSTLSMRRATRDTLTVLGYVQISIHALHEESDRGRNGGYRRCQSFQSTLSMRRATCRRRHYHCRTRYFNPRSP